APGPIAGTVNLRSSGSQAAVPLRAAGAGGTVSVGSATAVAPAAGAGPGGRAASSTRSGGASPAGSRPRHKTGRAASILVGCLVVAGLIVLVALLNSGGGFEPH